MHRRRKEHAGLLLLALAAPWLQAAAQDDRGGRDAKELRLPGLAIGKTYSTWCLQESPLVVRNPGDDTLVVCIEVHTPARHELRRGALPVPDRAWVQVETARLRVPPRASARADVRLTLPYDPDLAGHTYQVDIRCLTTSAQGTYATVLKHRLLFSVEMDYRDDTEIDLASRTPGRPTRR